MRSNIVPLFGGVDHGPHPQARQVSDEDGAVHGPHPDHPVEVTIQREGVVTRWPCAVCGGITAKHEASATFRADGHDQFVCEWCLAATSELLFHAWLRMLDAEDTYPPEVETATVTLRRRADHA